MMMMEAEWRKEKDGRIIAKNNKVPTRKQKCRQKKGGNAQMAPIHPTLTNPTTNQHISNSGDPTLFTTHKKSTRIVRCSLYAQNTGGVYIR